MRRNSFTFFLAGILSLVLVTPALPTPAISVLFSPDSNCTQAIVQQISAATKSIYVAMYYLTDREITKALEAAHNRGIDVRIVLDQSQVKGRFSKSRYLAQRGIPVRIRYTNGIMHNKFAVLDGTTVITGSFNWTASAQEKNDENLLIIADPEIASKYLGKFNHLWEISRPLPFTGETPPNL